MKTILFLLFLLFSTTVQAQETHVRLLFHDTHTRIADTPFGIAGWLVAPNITSSPGTWLSVLGPRYDGPGWNLELMGGGVITNSEVTPIIDLRLDLTPDLLGVPVYGYVNTEWVDPGDGNTLYLYAQLDYVMPRGIGLVGLETENSWQGGSDTLSVGPHIVVPLGQLAFVTAYQIHRGTDQLWIRCVINF